jgi:DNA modification methylase
MDPPYKNMAFDYKIFLFLIFPAMFKTISDSGKIFMFIDMENLDQVKTIFAVLDQFKKVYTHNLLIYPYRFPQTEEKAEPSYEHRYRGILLLSTKEKIQLTQYYHKKELVDLLTSPDQTEKIPFNVLKYIVNSATTEKELILNPFAEDGYVAQVLSSLNRKCIAIEKDPVKVKKAIEKRNLSKVETEKLSDVMSTLVKVK